MTYTKTSWVASTAPGISAANLNNLELQHDACMAFNPTSTYLAPLASPNLSGTPYAPTALRAVDSTQIATCAYVHNWFVSSTASATVNYVDTSTYIVTSENSANVIATMQIPPYYVNNSEFRISVSAKLTTEGYNGWWIVYSELLGSTNLHALVTVLTTEYVLHSFDYKIRVPGERIQIWGYCEDHVRPMRVTNITFSGTNIAAPTTWAALET